MARCDHPEYADLDACPASWRLPRRAGCPRMTTLLHNRGLNGDA